MLARHLSQSGIDVHVVGPFGEIEGATVHSVSLDVPLLSRLLPSLRAARMIRRLRPSGVVLEGPALTLGFSGATVIQMIHDGKFATRHRRRGGWILWLYYFVMCRLCDYTMTVSESEKERIASSLRLPRRKILVSYNGINDIWLTQPRQPTEKEFDLLYVSNFAPHKGHMRLLKCLHGRGLKTALVGGDLGTLDQARTYCDNYGLDVAFFRNLSVEDLIALYDKSRVFVFPSELEGFGIPFIEARARGLPVVASDIEVFHELSEKIGGQIVAFEDCEAVNAAISRAFEEPQARPHLEDFHWRHVSEQLIAQIFPGTPQRPRAGRDFDRRRKGRVPPNRG